ncbi:hypothetical protein RRF57_002184 [Xylaria bambusicola]|uniref:Uncharacterized protein n=1 Tax=Xylaria bambusicola TaxID=326684 RepID=A0AAN7UCM3_9PEZI
MPSQPLPNNGSLNLSNDSGNHPVFPDRARFILPHRSSQSSRATDPLLATHPNQLYQYTASGPFMVAFPHALSPAPYVRRYDNLGRTHPIVALRDMASQPSHVHSNDRLATLQAPEPEQARPNSAPPNPFQKLPLKFEQYSQEAPKPARTPHVRTQMPLDFGHTVIQQLPERNSELSLPREEISKHHLPKVGGFPPRRILPFPTPRKKKAEMTHLDIPHETTTRESTPKMVPTPTPQNSQYGANIPASSLKEARRVTESTVQTKNGGGKRTRNHSNHLSDGDFICTSSRNRQNSRIKTSSRLSLEQDSETPKYSIPKRSASQATTVSATSTKCSTRSAKNKRDSKAKHSLNQVMKINETMVHQKDMCDIIDIRLEEGNANSLNLLQYEVLFKQVLGSDERSLESILKILKS